MATFVSNEDISRNTLAPENSAGNNQPAVATNNDVISYRKGIMQVSGICFIVFGTMSLLGMVFNPMSMIANSTVNITKSAIGGFFGGSASSSIDGIIQAFCNPLGAAANFVGLGSLLTASSVIVNILFIVLGVLCLQLFRKDDVTGKINIGGPSILFIEENILCIILMVTSIFLAFPSVFGGHFIAVALLCVAAKAVKNQRDASRR